jgi:hypothetical protein
MASSSRLGLASQLALRISKHVRPRAQPRHVLTTSIRLVSSRAVTRPPIQVLPTPLSVPVASQTELPYHISRTPSQMLPVYHNSKAAGMQKFTMIKKVDGDKKVFIADLVAALSVPRENVKLNPVTGSINIKVPILSWRFSI